MASKSLRMSSGSSERRSCRLSVLTFTVCKCSTGDSLARPS
ncbi:MAG: hypothetical protein ACYSSI_08375 [Planctomycetota bacterium]